MHLGVVQARAVKVCVAVVCSNKVAGGNERQARPNGKGKRARSEESSELQAELPAARHTPTRAAVQTPRHSKEKRQPRPRQAPFQMAARVSVKPSGK
jgi:hypothetical protein